MVRLGIMNRELDFFPAKHPNRHFIILNIYRKKSKNQHNEYYKRVAEKFMFRWHWGIFSLVNSCGEFLWKLLSIFGGRKKKENINPLLNTKNHDFVISVNIIEKILKKS